MVTKYKYNVGDRNKFNLLILKQTFANHKSKIAKSGYVKVKAYEVLCDKHNLTFIKPESNIETNCYLCAIEAKKKSIEERDYKYNIGDILHDNLIILEKILVKANKKQKTTMKAYKVKCLIDNYECVKNEYELEKYHCAVCNNKVIIKGINDIATTHPHSIKYFASINDSYKYSVYSMKRVNFKCLDCGNIINMTIAQFSAYGLSCPKCGDGISYPNKFIFNMLEQLRVNFIPEKIFDWSENKRYDFYIPSLKCIIEAHGEQHYKETTLCRSLKEEQENDKLKQQLALKNGIKHYIVLDCRKSELEWIKESVINSKFPTLFNFVESNIDWLNCHELSLKNILKMVCNDYNSGNYNVEELSKKYKRHKSTIVKYLKKGNVFNWCNYDSELEVLKTRGNLNHDGKEVLVVETNELFPSISELSRQSLNKYGVKFSASSICNHIKSGKNYKGFTFIYTGNVTKYNQVKEVINIEEKCR